MGDWFNATFDSPKYASDIDDKSKEVRQEADVIESCGDDKWSNAVSND